MQLFLLLSLFLFSVALGSPSDVLYIEKLIADEAQLSDTKDFAGFANIFTNNATYDPGPLFPIAYGIDSIQAVLASIFPPETLTQNAIGTESITLMPPFDEQGAAGAASGMVDTVVTYIGQGDFAGQAFIDFGKFEDKYVKTGDFALYGGWRIRERLFIDNGVAGNGSVLPPSLQAGLPPEIKPGKHN